MKYCLVWLLFSLVASFTWAQSETATVSGQVIDPSGLNITGAQVKLVDIDRDTSTGTTTNNSGLYTFPSVRPGRYRIAVTAAGFKVVNVTGVTVNVQDHLEQNFKLVVGSVSESITVEGGAPLVDTESPAVSTVVDRNFAENLPMNGRSFQALIQLTPGVVLTANNGVDTGQFSVNGQRASSNYWMVDGVSANIGISTGQTTGNGLGGTLGSFNILGGTNSLVSVDALQEFRIQTSTFAPEFGRTPGAQISIVTRSGTNEWHGSAFDYFRNDALDANDWFGDRASLPKPMERQNDFGGTAGGPIVKDRTFFFLSYEGLRLRLPQVVQTFVPDNASRQNAAAAIQPYLRAYPAPNGADNLATGVAQFNTSFSVPATVDAYSVRIDHRLAEKVSVFGRYNYSPSTLDDRGGATALSVLAPQKITTQTGTLGGLWSISPVLADDFRFNLSHTDSFSSNQLDSFGGAVPLTSFPFPNGFTQQDARFGFSIFSLGFSSGFGLLNGQNAHNEQRQINFVNSVSVQKASHAMKFGLDFRRLSPHFSIVPYSQAPVFLGVPDAETGNTLFTLIASNTGAALEFRNLGVFAQDIWHILPRLTLTYGLRWDVDFAPSPIDGPGLAAVSGFNLSNLNQLALLPAGTSPFPTRYGNVAPRIGLAYQLSKKEGRQIVLRGGFGVFYDLATAEAGNVVNESFYPFGSLEVVPGSFPLSPAAAAPSPITPPNVSNGQTLLAFDPHLQLPYTLQWNVALEQSLGVQQTLTASYVGSAGRRLIQTASISSPNPNYTNAQLVTNAALSDYNALQLQFQRRLSHGLQALVSYTWSHSIDTGSAGSLGSGSNALIALNSNVNRGPSDFDVRNAFSMGLTYQVPAPRTRAFVQGILRGWSVQNIFQARTAPPVDVYYDPVSFAGSVSGFTTNVRPDEIPGQSFYLYGGQYPGGKAFNATAFTIPPVDPTTGLPLRQGNLQRNALRGFGAAQWDFAVHRDFPIREVIKLQFRAEMFNILNHPNFGQPVGDLGSPSTPNPQFGQSIQMLGNSLAGGQLGAGAFDPLYQLGGPRSVQLALRLLF